MATPREIAEALLAWITPSTIPPVTTPPDLPDALYTFSEAGQFEEESISVETAMKCWMLVEALKCRGRLPDQFRL